MYSLKNLKLNRFHLCMTINGAVLIKIASKCRYDKGLTISAWFQVLYKNLYLKSFIYADI